MNPIEFAQARRDHNREKETLKWLRQQPDLEKFDFIWRVYRLNPGMGLILAQRSQLKPIFREVILEHGFVYADASTIQRWLNATVQGLGHRRIVRMLAAHLEDAPLVVYKVLYWLPSLCQNHPDALQEVRDLRGAFEQMYPNFQSTRSTGIHVTRD